MKEFFIQIFSPKRNRYLIIGLILTIIGVLLIPFVIGIPIVGIGFTLFSIGALVSYGEKAANGKKIIDGFKKMFSQASDFMKRTARSNKNKEDKI